MHVSIGAVADHERSAAVAPGITPDRPDIDEANIVISQADIG
jgi:hypothetical protein